MFRVDGSSFIGVGHVMRCLALALELQCNGFKISFVCRALPLPLSTLISNYHIDIYWLKPLIDCEQADWLAYNQLLDADEVVHITTALKPQWMIADNYGVGVVWEEKIKSQLKCSLLVIDDLANRQHYCDLLLDQNEVPNKITRYNTFGITPNKGLFGSEFVLLRSQFQQARSSLQSYHERFVNKIITVCFGGADASNETFKAVNGLLAIDSQELTINVIVGSAYQNTHQLKSLIEDHSNIKLHQNITDIENYLSASFIAIGAVGTMTWERCCLGLPSVVASIADNQILVSQFLDEKDCHYYIGPCSHTSSDDYNDAVNKIMNNYEELLSQSKRISQLVDGLGAQRVVKKINEFTRGH